MTCDFISAKYAKIEASFILNTNSLVHALQPQGWLRASLEFDMEAIYIRYRRKPSQLVSPGGVFTLVECQGTIRGGLSADKLAGSDLVNSIICAELSHRVLVQDVVQIRAPIVCDYSTPGCLCGAKGYGNAW